MRQRQSFQNGQAEKYVPHCFKRTIQFATLIIDFIEKELSLFIFLTFFCPQC